MKLEHYIQKEKVEDTKETFFFFFFLLVNEKKNTYKIKKSNI